MVLRIKLNDLTKEEVLNIFEERLKTFIKESGLEYTEACSNDYTKDFCFKPIKDLSPVYRMEVFSDSLNAGFLDPLNLLQHHSSSYTSDAVDRIGLTQEQKDKIKHIHEHYEVFYQSFDHDQLDLLVFGENEILAFYNLYDDQISEFTDYLLGIDKEQTLDYLLDDLFQ